jgi:hypothetical protein
VAGGRGEGAQGGRAAAAAASAAVGEGADARRAATATLGEFRQVAPPVQSFASGRRR